MSQVVTIDSLRAFTNIEFGWKLRVIPYDEERKCTLFCGIDAAKSLGFSNPKSTIYRRCKRGVIRAASAGSKNQSATFDRVVKLTFIDEGDLYRLILGSRLPSARAFESWVMDQLLPKIRENGYYVENATKEKMFNDPVVASEFLKYIYDRYIAYLQTQAFDNGNELSSIGKMLGKSDDDAKNDKTSISLGDVAKLLSNDKVTIGRNNMLIVLREMKIFQASGPSKQLPYQKYIDNGCFKVYMHTEQTTGKETPVAQATNRGVALIKNAILQWLKKNPDRRDQIFNTPPISDRIDPPVENEFDDNGFIVLEEVGDLAKQAKEWYKKHRAG